MINLLPKKEKEELIFEEKKKISLILGIQIFVFLISLLLVLFSINIYILSQVSFQKIIFSQEEKRFEESEAKIFQEKLKFLNQEISNLSSFYKNQLSLTENLDKISGILPSGIYLTSFSFNTDTSQISLSGSALNRETLLKFKENLEKEKKFSQIYFLPNSWLDPTEFSVNLKILK
jgi:Tfp pilus assembly protein PilN